MKIETFIFVHDQNIIIDFIDNKKFKNINNFKYVFLGDRDTDKIEHMDNVIIARNFNKNIEQYKKLTAFTGWFLLWENDLIKSDFINLFEYDIIVNDNLDESIYENITKNENIESISYISIPINDYWFLGDNPTSKKLIDSVEKHYNINTREYIKKYPTNMKIGLTSNQTIKKETFFSYMEWMKPILDDIKDDSMAGHLSERSLPLYVLLNDLERVVLENVMTHFQLDSHNTQNVYEQKKYMYQNIIKS